MAAIRAVLRAAGPKKAVRDDKGTGSASLSSGPFSDPDGNSIRGAFFEHLPSFVDVDEEAGLTSALSRGASEFSGASVGKPLYPWIIRPKDPRKVAWDLVIALIIIHTVSVSPYRIGFDVPAEGGMLVFDWVVDVFFYLDVVLNFRTGYYQEETLVLSPRRIANNYLRGWFTLDFLSSFPFDSVLPLLFDELEKEQVRMLRMLRIFRLFRLGKLLRILRTEQVRDILDSYIAPTARNLTALLLWILYICHLFSCAWYFVGNAGWQWCEDDEHPDFQYTQFFDNYLVNNSTANAAASSTCASTTTVSRSEIAPLPAFGTSGWDIVRDESCQCPISFLGKDLQNHPDVRCENDVSWVRAFEIYRMPNLGKYMTSLYFVVKTVLAVGYGDLYPTNTWERMFCIFLELAGAVVYGYILSGITRSVDGAGLEALKLKTVNEWGQYRQFDNMLRRRIKQHYQFSLSQTNGYQDFALVEGLPKHLRNEIIDKVWPLYVEALTLALFPISKSSTSDDLIGYDLVRDLMSSLRPQQIVANDILCKQDDLLEDLYFMVSGRIEGLMDKNGFAKEAVKESKVYTKGWRTEITGLAEFEPLSSTQVSFDDLAEKSEVHTLVLDSLLVAVYERNEYFQTRFDPRVSNDADRISYFTYIAQTTSELIAIPTDVVSRTYREYHPEHMQASARHCSTLVNYLERCIGSGEFMHEEPDLTNEVVKRRATNRVFYRGKDWDVRELVGMGKAEHFMLSSMEEMVLQTIDDHRSWLEHHREEQEQRKAAAVKQAEQEGLPEEEDLMPYRRKKVTQNGQMYEKNKDSRRSMRKSASLRTMDASEAAKMEVSRQNAELFKMFLIPPKHPKKILWDSFMGCVIIFSVILVPYRIGFDVQPPPGSPGDAIDWLVDIVFAIDICLSFRTAYVDRDGQMITDWNKIRKNYVAGFFWIDLLSTIPFDRIFQVGRGATLIRVVRLIRLVKLLRLVKLTKLIDDLQELGISQRALNSLILVSQLTFLAHLLACGFFFVYDNQSFGPACQSGARFCSMAPDGNQGEQTGGQRLLGWFKEMDWLIPGGENEDYISALYWSFTTMTTVGYGDITPRSTTERIYCIFVMFVGGSAFGYIIGSIAASGTDAKEISMKPVYDFCDRQGLATVVRTKLRKHMTFYMEQKSNYDERTYLLELPVHLRIEVLLHIHREALASLRLFRPRLLYRDWFIAHIVSLMRPMVCVAGDLVYSKGQKDPYNVYSIFTGVCEAVDPDTEQVVAVYTHGMVFGLEGALTPTAEQIPKEDDNGYPCSVTAQPMVVPGSDRETVELFVLKQDVIQSLEDSGSVYFHPLKKLVATAWIQQKHDPYTVELSRRKKKVRDYLRAEMYKKRRGIVRLPRCYTSFTTIDGDDPDVGGGVKKSTTPAAASHGGAGGAGVITAGAQQGDGAPAPPGSAEKLAGGGGLLLSPDAFADVPHMQGRQVAVSVTHSGVATDSGTTAQGDFAPPGAAYERKEDYIISVPPGQDSPDVTLGHLTETTTVSLRSVSGIGPRNMMGTFIITPTPTRASTTMRSAMREVIDEGASPMSGVAGSVTPASPGGALLGGSTPGGSNMDVGGATPGATPALPGESAPPAGAAL